MKTLGKYTNLQSVGKGAMGEVYRTTDPSLGPVAIKVMSIQAGHDDVSRERFVREARVAAALDHPNIIDVHGMGEHEGRPYIVMEYLEGDSLKGLVRRHAEVSLEDRVKIMKQVCSALAYAHGNGLAHRDIKPENIFLTSDGQVRILDFGIARLPDSTMTATGALIGTPSYMSPEQVAGKRVDRRCDIFSAGTVFYEILTGSRAFAGRVDEVLEKITRFEPLPIHRLNELLPMELSAIVHKAMAKDVEQRYQSMDELITQLEFFDRSLSELRDKARLEALAALDSLDGCADQVETADAVASHSLPDDYLGMHAFIRSLSNDRGEIGVLIGELQWVSEVSEESLTGYGRDTLRTMANRVDNIRAQWPSESAASRLAKTLLVELRRRITAPASLISDPCASANGSGDFGVRT